MMTENIAVQLDADADAIRAVRDRVDQALRSERIRRLIAEMDDALRSVGVAAVPRYPSTAQPNTPEREAQLAAMLGRIHGASLSIVADLPEHVRKAVAPTCSLCDSLEHDPSHHFPKLEPTEDLNAQYVGTCDMVELGECDEPTVALVMTGTGWLSACRRHAIVELA